MKRIGTFYGAGMMADVSIGRRGLVVEQAFARRRNRLDRALARALEFIRAQLRWWRG